MAKCVRVEWLEMPVLEGMPADLMPGMRAGIDNNGDIWTYAGVIQDKLYALSVAELKGESYILDGADEFLRLEFMRKHLVDDESCKQILDFIEERVKQYRLH